MNLCEEGMFQCVFEMTFGAVFGVGLAVILLLVIAAWIGIDFSRKQK